MPQITSPQAVQSVEKVADVEGTWSVLAVRGREEKAIADKLDAKGVSVFLPLERSIYAPASDYRQTARDRRVIADAPLALFPGFFFAAWRNEYERECIAKMRHVTQVLYDPKPERLRRELSQIERLVEANHYARRMAYKPGDKVRITRGDFEGIVGALVRVDDKKCTVVVGVTMLGQSGIPIEGVPMADVERI